ncbi:MAG: hypothetical protein V7L20_23635 [Nostoc sp.]|uniref:hypothetical protein n=1 Tax=Nostoc sp. TaxID=1180 RepID=UPI002FF8257B
MVTLYPRLLTEGDRLQGLVTLLCEYVTQVRSHSNHLQNLNSNKKRSHFPNA